MCRSVDVPELSPAIFITVCVLLVSASQAPLVSVSSVQVQTSVSTQLQHQHQHRIPPRRWQVPVHQRFKKGSRVYSAVLK